jgi:hypothetical protein
MLSSMLRNTHLSRLEITQIVLIALGIILLLIGANYEVSWMINLGLLLAGAGVLSSGVDTLVSNRVGFWSRVSSDLYGSGVRAVLSGALLTLVGIWAWTFASIRLFGVEQQAGSYLASHPAVILLNVALLLFLVGAFTLLRLEGWRASFQNVLRALPLLLVGGLLLILAIFTLAIGLYAILVPPLFSSWFSGLLGS